MHTKPTETPNLHAWSTPTPVVADRPVLRFPNIVAGSEENTFVGYHIPTFDSSVVERSALRFLTEFGDRFDGPDGDWVFAWAHAALAPDGRLHLLWGEPRSRAPQYTALDWPPADIAVIWQSVRADDGTWSPPRVVLEGDRVFFSRTHRGGSALSGGRPAVLSFIVYARTPAAGVQSLVLENSGWRVLPAFRGEGRSVKGAQSAASFGSDGMFVAIAGEVPRGDGSPIIEYHNVNEKTGAWGNAEVAYVGAPTSSVQGLVALAGRDGVARVVILREEENTFDLTLVTRRAEGSWDSTSFRLPFAVSELHAAIDRDGRIHFVLENRAWSYESSHLYHVIHDGSWGTIQEIAPGIQGTAPALAIGRDGRPIVLFTQIKAGTQSLVTTWDPSRRE